MANNLMYPIALDMLSNKLVDVRDVENGKACNCYCFECKQDMVAINNVTKQRPHFRHDSNSNCSLNFETYIHWLTKELFKEIDVLYLPDLDVSEIKSTINNNLLELYNSKSVPSILREIINNELIENIRKRSKCIKLEIVEIEELYSTSLGDIRVDIVLKFQGKDGVEKKLFIEPFYSNGIDNTKLNKLKELKIPTISIDLWSFVNKKSHLFSKSIFKGFLINNITSKSWEYYNLDALLLQKDVLKIENRIKNNFENINIFKKLANNINVIDDEIETVKEDIEILKSVLWDKNKERDMIKNKLSSIRYV